MAVVVDGPDDPQELRERVERLAPPVVAAIVGRATGRSDAGPAAWDVAPLTLALGGSTAGLFRVSGQDPTAGAWSVVLKIVRPSAGNVIPGMGQLPAGWGDRPEHYNYWRRETLAYESGLTDEISSLGGGLRAPRFYGHTEDPSGAANRAWLWLEDVRGTPGGEWTPERYALAARHLGRFNGAYLSGGGREAGSAGGSKRLPGHDWLSRRWLRSWLMRWEDQLLPSVPDDVWGHPLVKLAYPDPVRDRLRRLWDERERLLAALEREPRTLGHLDVNPGNLFSVGPATSAADETVAIDWSFVGDCAAGEEIGQLLQRTLSRTPSWFPRAVEIRDSLFRSYVDGLRDVGWRGSDADEAAVRFAYLAHAALRWGLFVPAVSIAKMGESTTDASGTRPLEERVRQRAFLNNFLLDQADEAYELLAARGR